MIFASEKSVDPSPPMGSWTITKLLPNNYSLGLSDEINYTLSEWTNGLCIHDRTPVLSKGEIHDCSTAQGLNCAV